MGQEGWVFGAIVHSTPHVCFGPFMQMWSEDDASVWEAMVAQYRETFKGFADAKFKKDEKKANHVSTLDTWYQEELPKILADRVAGPDGAFMTHSELRRVMEWKLSRGKFRPALQVIVLVLVYVL